MRHHPYCNVKCSEGGHWLMHADIDPDLWPEQPQPPARLGRQNRLGADEEADQRRRDRELRDDDAEDQGW